MSIGNDLQLNFAADGSQTAATGTFDLSSQVAGRRFGKFIVTVSGSGTASFQLNKGLSSARAVEADSVATTSGHIFTINDGPWPYLTITWSGNSGADTVTCDAMTLHSYPGA